MLKAAWDMAKSAIGAANNAAPTEGIDWDKATGSTLASALKNTSAPALTDGDYASAANTLGVSVAHIKAVAKVESGPYGSFDNKGRPIILPEPHIFHRQTDGRFSADHPDLSYSKWKPGSYPKSFDARWRQLGRMFDLDDDAALKSASWGLFQVMGFNYEAMGYDSVRHYVETLVASEAGHLDSLVRFIKANSLASKLVGCKPGDPESCIGFVRAYNGPGYARNNYHRKLAEQLRRETRE